MKYSMILLFLFLSVFTLKSVELEYYINDNQYYYIPNNIVIDGDKIFHFASKINENNNKEDDTYLIEIDISDLSRIQRKVSTKEKYGERFGVAKFAKWNDKFIGYNSNKGIALMDFDTMEFLSFYDYDFTQNLTDYEALPDGRLAIFHSTAGIKFLDTNLVTTLDTLDYFDYSLLPAFENFERIDFCRVGDYLYYVSESGNIVSYDYVKSEYKIEVPVESYNPDDYWKRKPFKLFENENEMLLVCLVDGSMYELKDGKLELIFDSKDYVHLSIEYCDSPITTSYYKDKYGNSYFFFVYNIFNSREVYAYQFAIFNKNMDLIEFIDIDKYLKENRTKIVFTKNLHESSRIYFNYIDRGFILGALYNYGYVVISDLPTSVVSNEQSAEISIYPNPAGEYIEVIQPSEGLKPSEGSEITITNMLGVEMSTPSLPDGNATPQEGNFRIDVSHLPRGVYFLRIGTHVEKFVKW